ncbi:MAG: hypothetical protein PHV13_01280 [Candidatus ainarchaeum sp.]|nr:hypothetical protein [Candidatus ainarchaeum sp.]
MNQNTSRLSVPQDKLRVPVFQAPNTPAARFRNASPCIESPTTHWGFSDFSLSPNCLMPRGSSSTQASFSLASLRVRTKDSALDAQSIRTIARNLLSKEGVLLKEKVSDTPCLLIFSSITLDPSDSLTVSVVYEEAAIKVPERYSINVSASSPLRVDACKKLAMQFCSLLFAEKEKPHFQDFAANSLENMLSTLEQLAAKR